MWKGKEPNSTTSSRRRSRYYTCLLSLSCYKSGLGDSHHTGCKLALLSEILHTYLFNWVLELESYLTECRIFTSFFTRAVSLIHCCSEEILQWEEGPGVHTAALCPWVQYCTDGGANQVSLPSMINFGFMHFYVPVSSFCFSSRILDVHKSHYL